MSDKEELLSRWDHLKEKLTALSGRLGDEVIFRRGEPTSVGTRIGEIRQEMYAISRRIHWMNFKEAV